MPRHAPYVLEDDFLLKTNLSGRLVRLPCGVLYHLVGRRLCHGLDFEFAVSDRAGRDGNYRLSDHEKDDIQSGRPSVRPR